ncbi:MAG: hypothetical protein LKE46_08510 [Clostridium sp.]|jgi:hypothetical protein|uniref:glycosyltransferase family 9 protein n=1 Tax=Clostridium sp. TaxID=1506 RepID=UPI0025C0DEF6|nr:hypothetical protein [Clostridium sp.]MCH3964306.1 hypothetical protein [Clostridium sp.]MCI1715481.1 hypothetical protein [Clostridium sp.]MCI1799727.1 hypothetical protein [Clostridium sp.]MCI1813665.1 hypothetical protein [Clostridium sp.]MCI1870540.1 hypothetical protein [Clostridium sp.]
MKNILIIRSVSFQQLDLNIVAIKDKYPGYSIDLLTHEHGVKLAQKYRDVDNIYVYPYKEGFKSGNRVGEIEDKKFDIVVIPVTNISGAGFFNVLRYSKMISADKMVMCNVVSDLKEISYFQIYFMNIKSIVFKILSVILTAVISFFMIIFLPFGLRRITKKQ